MASQRETILQALLARLQTISGSKVLRNEIVPEKVPSGGLIILRDGDPGEPEVTLSPLSYYWQHRALLEVIVTGSDPATRDAALDDLFTDIASVCRNAPRICGNAAITRWSKFLSAQAF